MRFFGLEGQRQIPRNLKHGACLQKQHDVFIIHFILLHEEEKKLRKCWCQEDVEVFTASQALPSYEWNLNDWL